MFNEVSQERQDHYLAGISAGRSAQPEEVAGIVQWLASDEAFYVSGAIIPVDSGTMGYWASLVPPRRDYGKRSDRRLDVDVHDGALVH